MRREVAVRKLQKQKAECLEELVDFSGVAEAYDMAIEALKQPEIIRCKDCKHYKKTPVMCWRNDVNGWPVYYDFNPDDFCSYGERRTDEQT